MTYFDRVVETIASRVGVAPNTHPLILRHAAGRAIKSAREGRCSPETTGNRFVDMVGAHDVRSLLHATFFEKGEEDAEAV